MGCSPQPETKLIRIKIDTYKKLSHIKGDNESFNDVVNKCYNSHILTKTTLDKAKGIVKTELTNLLISYLEGEIV